MARMEIEGMRLKLAEDGTLLLADAEQEMGARPCAAGLLRGGYAIGTDSSTSIAIGRARAAGGVHGEPDHKGGKTITVIEHATTDATTDTGASGDSVGDVLTFANEVFDGKDARKVGTDQGYCVRVVRGTSYECNFTTLLAGGNIVVEGPFYDSADSVLAITGGTGRYRKVRGTMDLRAREGGTKFAFVFHLTG